MKIHAKFLNKRVTNAIQQHKKMIIPHDQVDFSQGCRVIHPTQINKSNMLCQRNGLKNMR